jgi:phage terminase Nu1 subunit (DNA packaging protein)
MNTPLLTEKELSAFLKCSVPALRVWRRDGLPSVRLGRLVRYQLDDVLAWFADRQFRHAA